VRIHFTASAGFNERDRGRDVGREIYRRVSGNLKREIRSSTLVAEFRDKTLSSYLLEVLSSLRASCSKQTRPVIVVTRSITLNALGEEISQSQWRETFRRVKASSDQSTFHG
jgi:hypothetical protein